jgi:hypothetical protein
MSGIIRFSFSMRENVAMSSGASENAASTTKSADQTNQ